MEIDDDTPRTRFTRRPHGKRDFLGSKITGIENDGQTGCASITDESDIVDAVSREFDAGPTFCNQEIDPLRVIHTADDGHFQIMTCAEKYSIIMQRHDLAFDKITIIFLRFPFKMLISMRNLRIFQTYIRIVKNFCLKNIYPSLSSNLKKFNS